MTNCTYALSDPVIEGSRAYAPAEDRIYSGGGSIPPITVSGIERCFISDDGSWGDYFLEMYGQVYRIHKLNHNTWVYAMPGSPQEMANFGSICIITAQDIGIKVVTLEDGTEKQRIFRIITANPKDKDGKERWIQCKSLESYHGRCVDKTGLLPVKKANL